MIWNELKKQRSIRNCNMCDGFSFPTTLSPNLGFSSQKWFKKFRVVTLQAGDFFRKIF